MSFAPVFIRRPSVTLSLRVLWIALQLIAAYCLAQQGELFFYQGF